MTNNNVGWILRSTVFPFFCLAFISCSGITEDGKPVIAVSILPQTWFVQQIAGDKVKLIPLAGPGQNLHTFEPSPKRLSELARADVWLLSGAEFELSLKPKIKNSFKNLAIVDTTESVVFRSLAPNEIDDDEEDSIDRHSWLGREPAKIVIRHIKNVLYMGNMGDRHEHRGGFSWRKPRVTRTHQPIFSAIFCSSQTVTLFYSARWMFSS